ncbi:MAG: glycosyltransferase family 2 protein [Chloroflexota bacterium]
MTTLSIVIPAYNEEDGIATIANRVLAVKPDLAKVGVDDLELLVVDDGSSDKTAEIANSIDGVTLIKHKTNKGYGAALKTGFGSAKGELVGFLDADGTYPPEYFPNLCTAALNGSDRVIGSRMAGADSQMPTTRRIGNIFFAGLLSLISRSKVTDSASGMRVFKKNILEQIYPLPDGLNLTPVMSTRAIHEGIRMKELPIPYSERLGRSKLSVVHDGRLFLESMIWTALTYNPVRILGMVGLFLSLLAIAIFAGITIARFNGVTSLGSGGVTAVMIALVTLVAGISLFSLGATFNYLTTLFHKRQVRQGLFGRPMLKTPLETYFGWLGPITLIGGLVLGGVSIFLSGSPTWDVSRLWLYLVVSAMSILMGVQFIVYWILLSVLSELSQRETNIEKDLQVD